MEIILNDKTYIAPAPKARMVRKAIELTDATNFNNLNPEEFDNLVGFVVDLYGKQFTIDDIYDELDADKLMPTIEECLNTVVGRVGAKLEQFPNAQTEK